MPGSGSLTADPIDMIADLMRRVDVLEQQGGFSFNSGSDGSSTSGSFPGGIDIGSIHIGIEASDPSGLAVTAGTFFNEAFIDVSWTNPSDNTIETTEVLWARKDTILGTYESPPHSDYTGGTAMRINEVIQGQTYGIRIVGRNHIGVASHYLPSSTTWLDIAVPLDATVPNAPTGIRVTQGADAVLATWNEVTDSDVKVGGGYEFQISSDNFATTWGTWRTKALVIAVSDIKASSTTPVKGRVRAYDSSGNVSAWDTTASTTLAGGVDGIDVLARSLAAVSIVADTITANEIATNTITATEMTASSITARELSAITLQIGKYIRSNNYVAGSLGWNIDASGNAEFSNVVIRGATYSGAIVASSISGGTIIGSAITGAFIQTDSAGSRIDMGSSGGAPFLEFWEGSDPHEEPAVIYPPPPAGTYHVLRVYGPQSDLAGLGPYIDLLGNFSSPYDRQIHVNAEYIRLEGDADVTGNFHPGGDAWISGHIQVDSYIQAADSVTIIPTFHPVAVGYYYSDTNTGWEVYDSGASIINVIQKYYGHGNSDAACGVFDSYYGRWHYFARGDGFNFYDSGMPWTAASSRSLKTDIKPLGEVKSRMKLLKPSTFRMKNQPKEDKKILHGFIAEDLLEAFPDIVSHHKDQDEKPFLAYAPTDMIPILVGAHLEMQAEVEALEVRLAALEVA